MSIAGQAETFHLVEGVGRPAIVLVHGAMCDHTNWDSLVPLLAHDHTIVRLDLAGHGRSPGQAQDCSMPKWAAQVVALVERLGTGPAILVGHSLGSRVVVQAAAQAPAHVAGLVMLDGSRREKDADENPMPVTAPDENAKSRFDTLIGPYASPEVRAAVRASVQPSTRALFAQLSTDLRLWDAELAEAAYASLPASLPILAIQSTIMAYPLPRRSLQPGETETPFLTFLRRVAPQVETQLIYESGHFNMMEHPAAVAEMILAFARRTGKLA